MSMIHCHQLGGAVSRGGQDAAIELRRNASSSDEERAWVVPDAEWTGDDFVKQSDALSRA